MERGQNLICPELLPGQRKINKFGRECVFIKFPRDGGDRGLCTYLRVFMLEVYNILFNEILIKFRQAVLHRLPEIIIPRICGERLKQ